MNFKLGQNRRRNRRGRYPQQAENCNNSDNPMQDQYHHGSQTNFSYPTDEYHHVGQREVYRPRQMQNYCREFNMGQEERNFQHYYHNQPMPFFRGRGQANRPNRPNRGRGLYATCGTKSSSAVNVSKNVWEKNSDSDTEEFQSKFQSTKDFLNLNNKDCAAKECYDKSYFNRKKDNIDTTDHVEDDSWFSKQYSESQHLVESQKLFSDEGNLTKGSGERNEEFSIKFPTNMTSQNSSDKVQVLRNLMATYDSAMQSIKPSEVIMEYRRKIDELAEKSTKVHQKMTERISTAMHSHKDKFKQVLEAHFHNLISQQEQFDDYIKDVKSQLTNLYDVDTATIINQADNLLKSVERECRLFKRSFPAYALKGNIQREVKANKVTIVVAESCYFLNVVLPHFISCSFPDNVIVSCVSNEMLKANLENNCLYLIKDDSKNFEMEKTQKAKDLEDVSSIQFFTEEMMITKDAEFYKKSCVIFDISLQRTIEADVLLANMRDILQKEESFKLILFASIYDDISKYKEYFSKVSTVSLIIAPTLSFPVKTVWKNSSQSQSEDYTSDVVKTIIAIHVSDEPGDILVFLSTVQDAKTTSVCLNKKMIEYNIDEIECILIHEKCQEKAILNIWNKAKSLKRRVVLSTSCAEQLIFPSVRHVIDCGNQRNLQYDPEKNFEVLITTCISHSRAKLRKALAGAFGTGICYRHYNKEDYCNEMEDMEFPEILMKSPFNSMVKLFQYRQMDAISIEFIDSLPAEVKENAMKLLIKCNAIKDGELTVLGKNMVKLPFPARYSKLVVLGIQWGFKYESVVLLAFFLVKGRVFQYSKDEEEQRSIDSIKLQLTQNDSDPLTYLHVFRKWKESNDSPSWCVDNCINLATLQDVENKISEICNTVHEALKENILQEFCDDKSCLLSLQEILFDCFRDNLCVFTGHYRSGYRMLSSQHIAYLHPSSSICQKDDLPQFVVFDHMLSTTRDFMMNVSSVPDFIIKDALQKGALTYDNSNLYEKKLVQKVIEPVGEMLIKSVLLGKKGKKLRDIEELIKKETNSDLIVVEPSVEKGCVVLYTLPDCSSKAEKIVREILSKKMEDILKEEEVKTLELKKGQNKVLVEVQWMKGAKTLSVKLCVDVSGQTSKQNNLAVNSTSVNEPAAVIQYSVNLTWPRRLCTGIGYVTYINSSDFQKARKHAMEYIFIHGIDVCIQISKLSPNQLFLSKLHPEVSRGEVEEAMLRLVPNTKIESIVLKYEPSFETTDDDIENFKDLLKNESELINLNKFEIAIPKPDNKATVMKSYINMSTTEEIELYAKALNDFRIGKGNCSAKPVYRCIMKCSMSIFQALQNRFKEALIDLEKKFKISKMYSSVEDLFDFVANVENYDVASLKLLSNYSAIIKELQRTVNDLLEGEIVDSKRFQGLHKLFCHGGHLWLQTLEKTANVFVIDEYKSKIIRLYGSRDDCEQAKRRISHFLEDAENEAVKKIDLARGKSSRVLLKAILKKYGVNLETYIEKYKLRSAILDIRSCHLTLHGSIESIENAETGLQEISDSQDTNIQDWLSSSQELCPVCVSPAIQMTFRLEHCGHLYCFECIRSLVDQAQFPIQCCAVNCDKDIVLEDIRKILDYNKEKISDLLEKSMREYIERNKLNIIYCPAPDCSMFYVKQDVRDEKWCCPLCQNEICVKCNVVYHHGYSCEMYQGSKADADYSFKVWQKSNVLCKRCPVCQTAIEKNEGCDHMHCTSCDGHFCWKCVKAFPTSNDVYNHQPYCPQNQTRY